MKLPRPSGRRGDNSKKWLLGALAILVAAACLRAPITALGPLVERIGASTELSSTAFGVLGALPVLGFAIVSPLLSRPAARLGPERLVASALGTLVVAIVLRSAPLPGGLWVGAFLVGGSIAVVNVMLPVIIKRDHPRRIALVTGAFTAVMGAFASLSAGIAVPLANIAPGGWRAALGAAVVIALPAALIWMVRSLRRSRPPAARRDMAPPPRAGSGGPGTVWRSATAWQVSLFMGLQSTVFYTLATWLPSIEVAYGIEETAAGWHLFTFQIMGLIAPLCVPPLLRFRGDQRTAAAGVGLLMAAAMTGLQLAPGAVIIWAVLAGLSSGSAIVVSLSLIGLRARNTHQTTQLSGMAQSVGYLLAACGPLAAGWLHQAAGSWLPVITLLVVIAITQSLIGLLAGRNRYVLPSVDTHGAPGTNEDG